MSMDNACTDVSRILDLDRHGGTLLRRDEHTALLMDHEMITFRAMETISTLHPSLQISTQACDSSSTGFMVVVVYKPRTGVLCSANTVLCVCTLVCVLWSMVLVGVYTTSANRSHV
jgi:hypothetical protein